MSQTYIFYAFINYVKTHPAETLVASFILFAVIFSMTDHPRRRKIAAAAVSMIASFIICITCIAAS